jgi:hypothetical protein
VLDRIDEELRAKRPTTLVFYFSLRFNYATASLPITWSANDALLGCHAVVTVATGRANSERFVRIKNSWGMRWADSGYAWLSEEYVNNTFIELVGMV